MIAVIARPDNAKIYSAPAGRKVRRGDSPGGDAGSRHDEVPTVESGDMAVQVLTPRSVIPGMYAARYRLAPSGSGVRPAQHEGHDWLYVLSGRLRVEFEQDSVTLAAGDSASFSSSVAHRLVAPEEPAEFLAVGATLLSDGTSA